MPGKSWKCRNCNGYNHKTETRCHHCGDQKRILYEEASTRERPSESHEQIPHHGYADGYGGYGTYGASAYHWKGQQAPSPYGKGPARSSYQQLYPGAYGAKGGTTITIDGSKGKGKGTDIDGNVYILQAPKGPLGKGGGKSKGKPAEEEEDQRGGVWSDGSPHLSRSPSARRGWRASRSRSRAKHALEDVIEEELEQSRTPGPPLPTVPKARPQRAPVATEKIASGTSVFTAGGEVINVEPVATDPADPYFHIRKDLAHSYLPHDVDDAKVIGANMESITNMLESLRGRTDVYAMKCRQGLEGDLQQLRIRRTQLKPLGHQVSILEALVEKKVMHFSAAEQLVHTSIAKMEIARTAMLDAQSQLLNVKNQKEEADARANAEAATAQADIPDNAKSLTKVKDLACLLPNTMAGEFGNCLAMLESILQQAKNATLATAQEVPDSDSEMASSESASSPFQPVPLFPGGAERLYSQEECQQVAYGDPYTMAEGAKTPPRGRAKSVGRSPGRSHSRTPKREAAQSSGLQNPPPPSPGATDGSIGFFLAENVAAPFHA